MSPFEKILNENEVVCFINGSLNLEFDNLNGIVVDLSTNEKLLNAFLAEYGNIQQYPIIFYKGKRINSYLTMNEEIKAIKYNTYAVFLDEFKLKAKYAFIIKGTIEKPYCKYTKQLLNICNELSIKDIVGFDIFTDDEAREVFKEINEWPSYPMIYVDGRFIGGLDKFKEFLNYN